eukprot:308419-Amorphochlora_amoeboformis.AAC.1
MRTHKVSDRSILETLGTSTSTAAALRRFMPLNNPLFGTILVSGRSRKDLWSVGALLKPGDVWEHAERADVAATW